MRVLLGAALLSVGVLAGCSGGTTSSGAPTSAADRSGGLTLNRITQQELCDVLRTTVTPADLGGPIAATKAVDGATGPSCSVDTAPMTMTTAAPGGTGDVEPAFVAVTASSPGLFTDNGAPMSAQDLTEELQARSDCPAGLSTSAGTHAGRPTATGLCGTELGTYSGVKVYYFSGFSVVVTTNWALSTGHRIQADVDAVADRVFDKLQQTA